MMLLLFTVAALSGGTGLCVLVADLLAWRAERRVVVKRLGGTHAV